jgi:hypothetical protein
MTPGEKSFVAFVGLLGGFFLVNYLNAERFTSRSCVLDAEHSLAGFMLIAMMVALVGGVMFVQWWGERK